MSQSNAFVRLVFLLALLAGSSGQAGALLYDQEVTFGDISSGPSDPVRMLYGAGINEAFTVERRNGIEVGLRAQLRFDANNFSQNIFNSNGDGTYSFATGTPDLSKPRPPWATTTTPVWSVAFALNTDYENRDGVPLATLADYSYEVGMDFDPVGTGKWLRFDPISANGLLYSLGVPDHAFGLYTQQTPGIIATTPQDYVTALQACNIVHNIATYETFNMNLIAFGMGDYSDFDPNQAGVYTIYLAVFSGTFEMARTEIQVWVGDLVPVPSVLGMTPQDAQSTLAAANLTLGTVTQEYSQIQAGTVISQFPANTEGLPPGGAVSVVVSKGEAPKVPAAGFLAITLLAAAFAATGLARLRTRTARS